MQYMLAKLVDLNKTRFSEHYLRIKKPRKIDRLLYRHFKQTNHSISIISILSVQKITYDYNSTKRYSNIFIFLYLLVELSSYTEPKL